MKKKKFIIEDHEFYVSLRKGSFDLFFTKSLRPRTKLNRSDSYHRNILEVCLRLSAILETLELSREFIEERRNSPYNNSFKVSNSQFLRYHLECYYIRITSFKDLVLKLINRVYLACIRENIGLEKNLAKFSVELKFMDIDNLLIGLNIIMNKIEPTRHRITHGNYHEDVDLILIESMERNRAVKRCIKKKDYDQTMKRFMYRNTKDMFLIELMMKAFLELTFDTLYKVRMSKEKDLNKLRGRFLALH